MLLVVDITIIQPWLQTEVLGLNVHLHVVLQI